MEDAAMIIPHVEHCQDSTHNGAHKSADEDIIHAGWLTKCGLIRKSWKTRWFTLSNKCKLRYYENEGEDSLIGDINLSTCSIRTADVRGRDYCFEVVTQDRIWLLQASDYQEMMMWVELLSVQANQSLHHENQLLFLAEEMMSDVE
eukprot:Colp12_sorted_trinity150504_noHs@26303